MNKRIEVTTYKSSLGERTTKYFNTAWSATWYALWKMLCGYHGRYHDSENIKGVTETW